jgi:uncharacterized membrane protein
LTAPAVFWPTLLGLSFLVAGIFAYRRELHAAGSRQAFGLVALGQVFVAAALAAFAGEHFTLPGSIAQIVPKFMPAPLFIVYLVGVAHLSAALSFVARRYLRWSSISLAIMFALFVLLMDLPGAIAHHGNRLNWILAAREATFAMGGLAMFSIQIRQRQPQIAKSLAAVARVWLAAVIIFYGVEHVLHPEISPGVPDSMVTAAWVPLPLLLAYVTGALLIACGIAMFAPKLGGLGASLGGLLMLLLTLVLYCPQFFLAQTVPQRVNAINFIFDTLLFAGTMFVIARAILESESRPIARSPAVE